jgi:hypothetical protein
MKVLYFLAAALLCFGNLEASQQVSAPASTSSPQAVSLLARSAAALNGNVALSDVTLTGTARRIAGSEDESGTFTYKSLSSGAARFDFSYPSGLRSEVHTDVSSGLAGSWSGPDGNTHPLALHNLVNRSDIFPAFTLAQLASSQNLVIVLVGQETKNGHSTYHLSAFLQEFPYLSQKFTGLPQRLTQTEIFIDTSTLLPVAFDFNTHPDDDLGVNLPVELLFSDYRSTSGSQIPFRIQKFLNNGLILDLQFQSAVVNSGLSLSLFNVQ